MTQERFVLLTRPMPDSMALQTRLLEIGINSFIAPTLEIIPAESLSLQPLPSQCAGVIITSRHAVPFIPHLIGLQENIPLFSIGNETTEIIEKTGYSVYATAKGNSASLREILDTYCLKNPSALQQDFIHYGGAHLSDDFRKYIIGSGLKVHCVTVYQALALKTLPDHAVTAIMCGKISHILLYSARSAEVFIKLCAEHELVPYLQPIEALCLAASVVKSLDNNVWKAVHVAEKPCTSSMLRRLEEIRSKEYP
jgi:uroporphyrinogen-III synthase